MTTYKLSFIPLSLGLMTYPSLVWQVAWDEDKTKFYGVPMPWNSASLVSSLEKNIYWFPLVVDILFYGIVGYILWKAISRYIECWSAILKYLVVTFIWLYGVMASILLMTFLAFGRSHRFWFDYDFRILNVALGFSV